MARSTPLSGTTAGSLSGALGLIPGILLVGAGGYWIFLALMVVGFLAAEALVGRRLRSPDQPT